MVQTITAPTLESLPAEERLIIRSAILALNAIPSAKTAAAIEAEAFRNEFLRSGLPDHLQEMLRESAAAAGFTDLSGPIAVEIERRREFISRMSARALWQLLRELVRDSGLPAGKLKEVAKLFEAEVTVRWDIECARGHARIGSRLTFNSANGLMAYVILRLSELIAVGSALLQCAECRKFKLIESTGGDHITKFCSTKCRNRFNVREWRRQHAGAPMRNAGKHK